MKNNVWQLNIKQKTDADTFGYTETMYVFGDTKQDAIDWFNKNYGKYNILTGIVPGEDYGQAIANRDEYTKMNSSINRTGAKIRNRKLNSAVDNQGNVTLTIPYYIWRLVYTCVYGYSERSSDIIYGDGKFDGYLNSIIHKIESALHGTWETLNVNQDPEGEKMDFYLDTNTRPGFEERELTDADTQSISITFTVQEGQVIYRCLEVMEDQYANSYIFSDEDLAECYNIQKYIEGQLQMTGRQIIDATAFNSSRKNINIRNRKLNSSADNSYMDVYDEVADVVREVVFDHIIDILDECNIANITSRVPEYDGDWCATEWTADDDDKKFDISDALVDFVLDGLFRHAGNELEVKFKEK